jgi:hypothetical protein
LFTTPWSYPHFVLNKKMFATYTCNLYVSLLVCNWLHADVKQVAYDFLVKQNLLLLGCYIVRYSSPLNRPINLLNHEIHVMHFWGGTESNHALLHNVAVVAIFLWQFFKRRLPLCSVSFTYTSIHCALHSFYSVLIHCHH